MAREEAADEIFDGLIQTGNETLSQEASADFFAKFGERQSHEARQASAHYSLGLGYLGKGLHNKAEAEFEKAVKLNVSHVWANA